MAEREGVSLNAFAAAAIAEKVGAEVAKKDAEKKVPDSGIYESSKSKQRATLVKGEPAPPTPKKNEEWVQKVDTNKKT
jgi:hypothetical protein